MKIQMVAIDRVLPYARNPRTVPDGLVQRVAASIKEFGFRQPIVVDEAMTVIVGHTRLEAARLLGLDRVPVHVAKDMEASQAKAYRIADNRLAQDAEWDKELLGLELTDLRDLAFDLPVLGFTEAELKAMFEPAVPQLDEADESNGSTGTIICPNCGHEFEK